MRRILGTLLLAPLLITAAVNTDTPRIQVVPHAVAPRVDVTIDGKPFTSYIYLRDQKKPSLFPIRAANGAIVTRGWPLEPRANERIDHRHHVGLWFNYGSVNGLDFWNNSDDIGPDRAPRMGTVIHKRLIDASSGKDKGELNVEMDWVDAKGTVLIRERTHFVFQGDAQSRVIERITRLSALKEPVTFGESKEGVFGMRVTRALEQPSNTPEALTDASGKETKTKVVNNDGVTGEYIGSDGKRGDAVWGTRGPWTMLTGKVGSEGGHAGDVRPSVESGVPDLLARPRLRIVRRQQPRPAGVRSQAARNEADDQSGRIHDVPPPASDPERHRDTRSDERRTSQVRRAELRSVGMRIGILGGGNISGTHARAAAAIPGVEVVAVHGSNHDRAAKLAEPYRARVYDDLEQFLAHRPMDIVAIGSPSGLHAEQGIAAAKRGLHVLVEKPLDITTAKADALIAACDAAGVKLGVFFQDRLRPAVVEIKKMIDDGTIGTPVMISGRVKWYRPPDYYSASRWRGTWTLDGGGALMNQAIHTVDLVQWMFGPVARVSAAVATLVHEIKVEDTAAAVIEFTNGAIGTIEAATSLYPGYPRRLEVTGSKGTLVLEDDKLTSVDLQASSSSSPSASASAPAAEPPENASSPVVSDASAHQRVIEDFIRAIKANTVPSCDGREGRRSVELVEAIYAAARERRPMAPPASGR